MARLKAPRPTLDQLFFSTPEQKVLKLLLSEPTTAFSPRTITSNLKNIRGLGGSEGLARILTDLRELGLVDFVDNHRSVRLRDDGSAARLLKTFLAVCDLETLWNLLEPLSTKGILFGSRATGRARSDSDYDLFVVSEAPEEACHLAARHPLGKKVELVAWTPERYEQIGKEDPMLRQKLASGLVLWGTSW